MTEVKESHQFVVAGDGTIRDGKSLWRCTVCEETFWHSVKAADLNDWEHTCEVKAELPQGSNWEYNGLMDIDNALGKFRCKSCGHRVLVNLEDDKAGRETPLTTHTCKISGTATLNHPNLGGDYHITLEASEFPAGIQDLSGEKIRTLLAFLEATEEEKKVIHKALNQHLNTLSEPTTEALWAGRYDSAKVLAQLVPFLEAGFKLAKRRLASDSDSGQYLTNLATMQTFKDVLDFVRKGGP